MALIMKIIESMNYRQWQERNTQFFQALNRDKQKEARKKGYHNVGWERVKLSWNIVSKLSNNVTSLFDSKVKRGDLVGAIELSIIEAERGKRIAKNAINKLKKINKS